MTEDISNVGKKRVVFDPTINLGNAVVLAAIILGGAIAWGQITTRLDSTQVLAAGTREVVTQLEIANGKLAVIAEATEKRITRLEDEELSKQGVQPK